MMPAGARSKPHPIRPKPPVVLLAALLGVSLFPTTLARELPTYKVHVFLPPDLYRESETPEELNPSAVSRMRDQIREVDPGVTLLGTLPSWVFPLFAHAASEPNFSPHRDITGVDVPEALSQCIPSLKSPEYRRLMGIRNRVWAAIVREFPEINHWIVGPEPIYHRKGLYSPLVDCKGRNLRGFDVIEFIVDTLEQLHPAINQANPCAKVISHFSYVPFDEDPDIDLPRLIQVEIQRRGNDPEEYYDLSTKKIELTCQLMKEGIILKEVGVSLEANGQVAQFIEEMFTETDTPDFAGSVRCTAPWRELFTGVAVEMDANNRIFTTLPIVPVRQWPLEKLH